MLWSIGFTIYTVIYSRISTCAVVASNIALTIERFAFVFFIGLANARAVLIGNYIGKKEYNAENVLLIVGIFRSGGDTTFSLIVDAGAVWFFGIQFGILAAFILKLSVPLVFLAICSEEFVKIILSLIRYFNRKWVHNVL